jgi:hypothetical protein
MNSKGPSDTRLTFGRYLRGRRAHVVLLVAALSGWLAASNAAFAMPYCALRDPVHELYALFPQANAYRSSVKVVNEDAREKVSARLPFTLHSRELGQHTLYIPLHGATPLGFVHVRSEPSEWGLVEVAWALDRQLKVIDFRFQRCRGPGCDTLAQGNFGEMIRGRGFEQLKLLLSDDGKSLRDPKSSLAVEDRMLAVTVLRSAVKTIAVTGAVWEQEVLALR